MPISTSVSSRSASQAVSIALLSPAAARPLMSCWKVSSASATRSSNDLLFCWLALPEGREGAQDRCVLIHQLLSRDQSMMQVPAPVIGETVRLRSAAMSMARLCVPGWQGLHVTQHITLHSACDAT